MNLHNAKILITGGSAGLGKSMAEVLIEAGAKVAITGRDTAKLQRVAQEIGAIAIESDMTAYDTFPATIAECLDQLGGLEVLINNAGIGEFALMDEVTAEQFESIFSVNVFGLALLTQEAVKYFKAQGYGHILNIASTASMKGFAQGSVYAASKFALRGMTQCWQNELRKFNIRVIQINPSEVPTAFNSPERIEKEQEPQKLTPLEISHTVKAALEVDDRGFIPEVTVWATNPWKTA